MVIQRTVYWRWGDKGINKYDTENPGHMKDLIRVYNETPGKDVYHIEYHEISYLDNTKMAEIVGQVKG